MWLTSHNESVWRPVPADDINGIAPGMRFSVLVYSFSALVNVAANLFISLRMRLTFASASGQSKMLSSFGLELESDRSAVQDGALAVSASAISQLFFLLLLPLLVL